MAIPEGLCILTIAKQPCVLPAHLRVGTHKKGTEWSEDGLKGECPLKHLINGGEKVKNCKDSWKIWKETEKK